ncbi:MAG TPA: hypothetical protein VGM54_06580 [Chthoniobacter sp.]|jgi:hypothetical protein
MILRLFFLFLAFVVPHLNAVEGEQSFSQIQGLPPAERDQKIRARLSVILNRYEVTDIDPNSEDYKFLEDLGHHSDVAIGFTDDLIRLTVVREPPLTTTERYRALDLSPAGRALAGIGMPAETKVKAALADPRLDPWQRLVLTDVLPSLHHQGVDNAKEHWFQYESRDPNELYPRAQSDSQPPQQSPPQKNPLPNSNSTRSGIPFGPTATSNLPRTAIVQQNRLSPWLIVVVLIGLFIGACLLRRRQK